MALLRLSSPLDFSRASQRMLFIAILLALAIFMSWFIQLSGQASWLEAGDIYEEWSQHTQNGAQYNKLADAIIDGKVSLDLPVSDILLNMENPYDTAERTRLNAEARDVIYWDYAYYNEQYYCYFGILPCLLTFVPFKLITGLDLRNDYAVLFFAILTCCSIFYFLKNLSRAYVQRLSVGDFLISYMALLMLSGIFEQIFLPRIYPIPILSSLLFTFLGLAFWLKAKTVYQEHHVLKKSYLLIGGISIAATLGCRPQYVLAAFLAFAIFIDQIKEGLFFSRKGLTNTICVIAPFIVIAIPICLYNYVRFESPFNFGASYNLTGADMTSYTFSIPYIAVHALEYLFLPLSLIPTFPYIAAINETQPPWYLWTNEPFYAGFCILMPVALFAFGILLPNVRKQLQHHGMLPLVICSIVLCTIVIVIVSYVSGVTMRYFSDFGWLLGIATIATFWSACAGHKSKARLVFILLTIASVAIYFWTFLGTGRIGALTVSSPALYQTIQNIFTA